jgi:putative MATE family efflux protein
MLTAHHRQDSNWPVGEAVDMLWTSRVVDVYGVWATWGKAGDIDKSRRQKSSSKTCSAIHGLWKKKGARRPMFRLTLWNSPSAALDREIGRLAIPAFFSLIALQVYLLVDAAVVGRLGTLPLAGLGAAGAALAVLVGLCVFLAYGTTASVARHMGAGNRPAAVAVGIDGMWLALVIGLVSGTALAVFAPWIVTVFGASPKVAPFSVSYLRVVSLGVPAFLVVFAGTGVLRGLHDTRTPLVVEVVAASVAIPLTIGLVHGIGHHDGLGIAGSALATALAQTGAAGAYLVIIRRGARKLGVSLRPDFSGIWAAARRGVPLVARTASLQAVLLLAVAVAGHFGDASLAAYQVASTTGALLALALDSIAIAAQAIIGRLLGGGNLDRITAVSRRMVWWGVIIGGVLGIALAAARPLYVPLFTQDPAVRELLSTSLLIVAFQQLIAGPAFVLDGILIGAGDGPYLARAQLASTLVFGAAAWVVVALDAGLAGLWWAYALWLLTRLTLLGIRARSNAWRVGGAFPRQSKA